MKESIDKQLKKIMIRNESPLDLRRLIRDFETYSTITEAQQDELLRKLFEERKAELAAHLRMPIVRYNLKFQNFTFSNKEIELMINYLNN